MKAGNNAIDHSQGETGVGMWKYAVGGGMDKAEGGEGKRVLCFLKTCVILIRVIAV